MPAPIRAAARLAAVVAVALAVVPLAGCAGPGARDAERERAAAAAAAARGTWYTSGEIALVRFAPETLMGGAATRYRGRDDRNVTRLRIAPGTPGVVLASGEGWLAVAFGPEGYLYFRQVREAADGTRIGDARVAGRYYLDLPDWDGRAGTLRLGDARWLAVGGSRDTYLVAEPDGPTRAGLSSRWLDERR